jgi:uncharacterized protein (TIGR02444 family)
LGYQDNDGANVNLLLFCCWLGFSGHRIEPEALEQARSLIEKWDLQAVQKLRAIRRFLVSSQWASSEMVKSEMIQSLQQVELMAEQVVQNVLYDWWLGKSFCHSHEHGDALQKERLQAENLNTYLDTLGCQPIPTDSPLLCPLYEPQTST